MPHVDDLLGPATFAAAGLFAAIALQAMVGRPAPAVGLETPAAATKPAVRTDAAPVVRLPTVEIVARRSVELARAERGGPAAGGRQARAAARPAV